MTRWGSPLHESSSLANLDSREDSAYYYDQLSATVHVKLVADGDWEEVRVKRTAP